MAWGQQKNPKQEAAIAESYKDREKMIKPQTKPAALPKVPNPSKFLMPKPHATSVPAAPAFGRRRFYGSQWG